MLDHQKIVLKGVSSNKELFKKELIKSLTWLNFYEVKKLKKWVIDNFGDIHPEIIQDVINMKYEYV